MCGIIGILGQDDAAPGLLEGLRRLEYRGYDSAGVAIVGPDGRLHRRRAAGKLSNLADRLRQAPLTGAAGIGHTRWATHGAPTEVNAHPHQSGRVAVVHNGIIENFRSLRERLGAEGRVFETDTDTEVVAHLIDAALEGRPLTAQSAQAAFREALDQLDGAFALAVVFEGLGDLLLGARRGSPLVVGLGDGAIYLGSDAIALAPFTDRVVYLEEDDWCALSRQTWSVFDAAGALVERPETLVQAAGSSVEKGDHRHFMQKEMFEQPDAAARTLGVYLDQLTSRVRLPQGAELDLAGVEHVHMIACGSGHYACAVAEYWFERVARVSVEIDIASEFRYRDPVLKPGALAVFVSQSGETADTLAALRYCKAAGLKTAAMVNVPTSTIAREADVVLPTMAGVEIGVASTKAFTAQLCALAAASVAFARARGEIDAGEEARLADLLGSLPRLIGEALLLDEAIERLAYDMAKARDVLYLGRGQMFPIALEGALKLKEISYIHAEGYAAGELKHGPIALIDDATPVVFVAPHDAVFEKSLSNLEEVAARHGKVLLISDATGIAAAGPSPALTLEIPTCDPFLAPIVATIPVQLLAYHVAVEKGTDVDQPRNLAKSVTVE